MSKEPEVGDLWESKKSKRYLVFVSSVTARLDAVDVINKNGLAYHICDKKQFAENYIYKGKSKGNLSQLFEVEGEDEIS